MAIYNKLSALVLGISCVMGTSTAFAATATPPAGNNTMGTITFEGAIIEGACDLQSNDDNQKIPMGQASVNTLAGGGKGELKKVVLHLINCDTNVAKTVKAAFTGATDGTNKEALMLDGLANGAGIHMQTSKTNKPISWDGTPTADETLTDGNFDLVYLAQLVGNGGDEATITPGTYTATTNFELSYQ